MMPVRLMHAAALAPSLLQLWWLFHRATVRQLIYKHTLPILNPTVIVELTSTAQSLKQQLIQLDCFAITLIPSFQAAPLQRLWQEQEEPFWRELLTQTA